MFFFVFIALFFHYGVSQRGKSHQEGISDDMEDSSNSSGVQGYLGLRHNDKNTSFFSRELFTGSKATSAYTSTAGTSCSFSTNFDVGTPLVSSCRWATVIDTVTSSTTGYPSYFSIDSQSGSLYSKNMAYATVFSPATSGQLIYIEFSLVGVNTGDFLSVWAINPTVESFDPLFCMSPYSNSKDIVPILKPFDSNIFGSCKYCSSSTTGSCDTPNDCASSGKVYVDSAIDWNFGLTGWNTLTDGIGSVGVSGPYNWALVVCLTSGSSTTKSSGYRVSATTWACGSGYFCPDGVYSGTACSAGYFSSSRIATTATDCKICAPGKYSREAAKSCTLCSAGKYQFYYGKAGCNTCSAGKYSLEGSNLCTVCDTGTYCPAGASSYDAFLSLCPLGFYCPTPASKYFCTFGFCPQGVTYPFGCPFSTIQFSGAAGLTCSTNSISLTTLSFFNTSTMVKHTNSMAGTWELTALQSSSTYAFSTTYAASWGPQPDGFLSPDGYQLTIVWSVISEAFYDFFYLSFTASSTPVFSPQCALVAGLTPIPQSPISGISIDSTGTTNTFTLPYGYTAVGCFFSDYMYTPALGGVYVATSISQCPAGSSCATGTYAPVLCGTGTYSGAGAVSCTTCPFGTFSGIGSSICSSLSPTPTRSTSPTGTRTKTPTSTGSTSGSISTTVTTVTPSKSSTPSVTPSTSQTAMSTLSLGVSSSNSRTGTPSISLTPTTSSSTTTSLSSTGTPTVSPLSTVTPTISSSSTRTNSPTPTTSSSFSPTNTILLFSSSSLTGTPSQSKTLSGTPSLTPAPSISPSFFPVPPGYYFKSGKALICPVGSYCPYGSTLPMKCPFSLSCTVLGVSDFSDPPTSTGINNATVLKSGNDFNWEFSYCASEFVCNSSFAPSIPISPYSRWSSPYPNNANWIGFPSRDNENVWTSYLLRYSNPSSVSSTFTANVLCDKMCYSASVENLASNTTKLTTFINPGNSGKPETFQLTAYPGKNNIVFSVYHSTGATGFFCYFSDFSLQCADGYLTQGDGKLCVVCPLGSVCINNEAKLCATGHFCPLATLFQIPCPIGTFSPTGGASSNSTCLSCPCAGGCPSSGLSAPFSCSPTTSPTPSITPSPTLSPSPTPLVCSSGKYCDSTGSRSCYPPEACAGGIQGGCSAAYTGFMCAQCQATPNTRYYKAPNLQCLPCTGQVWILLPALVAFPLVLCLIWLLRAPYESILRQAHDILLEHPWSFAILGQLLTRLSLLNRLTLVLFPGPLRWLFGLAGLVTGINTASVGVDCVVPWQFEQKYWLVVAGAGGVVALLFFTVDMREMRRLEVPLRQWLVWDAVAFFLPLVLQTCWEALTFVDFGGRRLLSEPATFLLSPSHYPAFFTSIFLIIVLFVFGLMRYCLFCACCLNARWGLHFKREVKNNPHLFPQQQQQLAGQLTALGVSTLQEVVEVERDVINEPEDQEEVLVEMRRESFTTWFSMLSASSVFLQVVGPTAPLIFLLVL